MRTTRAGCEAVRLYDRIGALFAKGGRAMEVVDRYKAQHGGFQTWPEEVLRQCIAEAEEGSE